MMRVELYEQIRKASREEGLGVRALAARFRVHRRVVRQALQCAVPPARKVPVRVSPALGPWQGLVRQWLEEDRRAPRKQRHTAHRVWWRLVHEYGAVVAESTVRTFVAELRRELDGQVGEVMVPQAHAPGAEAEVDFGAFAAWVDGVWVDPLWMFCMRLSASGRGFHEAFANQAIESFLEGHVHAFEHFGGVPAGLIRYDNLKDAVVKVLLGRARLENPRFVALRSHYGFDSWYCRPGLAGSHEKGGVENEIGRFRRNHLVPVPRVKNLAELNELLAGADAADDGRCIGWRPTTVGEDFLAEADQLRPPPEPYDTATVLHPVADTKARITVRQAYYSVPARLARRRVEVRLGARRLEVRWEGKPVAVHDRALHKGEEHLLLDHYLEVLVRKPGALAGSVALAQARAAGVFGPTHQAFWDRARQRHGDGAGTRALCMVLVLHRSLPAQSVAAGMEAALAAGSVDPEVVAVEARRHRDNGAPLALVVPIEARLAHRPPPRLDGYDQLLGAGR